MIAGRWPALVVLTALLVLAAACGGGDDGGATPSPAAATVVEYLTADGVQVVADFAAPEAVEDPPVVILLHQRNGTRQQWAPLFQPLLDAGYAVLAPDLRSFGESTRCSGGTKCEFSDPRQLVDDVGGAIAFTYALDEQVDHTRIAIIGASIGANGAYAASGLLPDIDTAIAMSPSPDYFTADLDVRWPAPHSVLFMADEDEAEDSRAMAADVEPPVEVKVYEGVRAHGVELLAVPQAVQDILDWLRETL